MKTWSETLPARPAAGRRSDSGLVDSPMDNGGGIGIFEAAGNFRLGWLVHKWQLAECRCHVGPSMLREGWASVLLDVARGMVELRS